MNQILFVDDEQIYLEGLKRNLQKKKYNWFMSFVDDADTALQNCFNNDYDVIVSDISMPGKSGFEFLKVLKGEDRTKDIPVVFMTGLEDENLKNKALEMGATDLLDKQLPIPDLLARIDNCIRAKISIDEIKSKNRLLEKKVLDSSSELQETRMQVIRLLGRAAEFKDNETGMHAVRMAKFSALLGRQAGLTEEQCDLIHKTAPMHDIGKIGIPDNVLLKPGKLEFDEREIMKKHVIIGADILSGGNSEVIHTARLIVLHHHEKWNGRGYPFGLKENEISIEGRIVALCDVFDALTSNRPYKDAWPFEKAVQFIEEQKGIHFDPKLVEHFKVILPEIQAIKHKYDDGGLTPNTP